jgi:uncharacterized metal-binding protein YceD (DUF177 family)
MKNYTIRFSGLKEGVHQFNFELGDTFFEQLDYSEIKKASLHVEAVFEKKQTMLVLNFNISGDIEVMCDKCTDDFRLNIDGDEELIYKFGEGISNDEKVIIIPENEFELDLIQPFYEAVILALPSRRVHPDKECNQEMLKTMDSYLMVESEETEQSGSQEEDEGDDVDPRWAALNKLK